jgi:hypothetical protein
MLNHLTLALLTVNLPMSTHPTVANKEGIWYDYLCPHKKEEMTRTTSRQEIFKVE